MAAKKKGFTITFQNPPVILSAAGIAGRKEGEGPLGSNFDRVIDDPYFGEKHWEAAEQRFLEETVAKVLQKANLKADQIDFFLAGDLLNQMTPSSFTGRSVDIPFVGLFSACSTFFQGMALGGVFLDGGFADLVLAAASSHFGAAERRVRYAVEQAVPRPPSAGYTVTGAGAMVLGAAGEGPVVTHAVLGRVVDYGIDDPNDYGAARVPAAVDTAANFLHDTGLKPDDFDLVLTGDLGHYGSRMFGALMAERGYVLEGRYRDCGMLIYDRENQHTHAGGGGCACPALVTCGWLMEMLRTGRVSRVLALGTGALVSAVTTWQGETVPAVSHAVVIEKR